MVAPKSQENGRGSLRSTTMRSATPSDGTISDLTRAAEPLPNRTMFRALDFGFSIAVSHPSLGRYLADLYRPFADAAADGAPVEHSYALLVGEPASELRFDGSHLQRGTPPEVLGQP